MVKLYFQKLTDYGHTRYILVKDGIIFQTQMVCPFGWAEQEFNPFQVEFIGKHYKDKSITDYFEFKEKKTKMTQEQLSKGWNCK